jgi:hypothetical protein
VHGITEQTYYRWKPTDNAASNRSTDGSATECLNVHWFQALEDARDSLVHEPFNKPTWIHGPVKADADRYRECPDHLDK